MEAPHISRSAADATDSSNVAELSTATSRKVGNVTATGKSRRTDRIVMEEYSTSDRQPNQFLIIKLCSKIIMRSSCVMLAHNLNRTKLTVERRKGGVSRRGG